jgi:hypothetical protein
VVLALSFHSTTTKDFCCGAPQVGGCCVFGDEIESSETGDALSSQAYFPSSRGKTVTLYVRLSLALLHSSSYFFRSID